MKKILLLLLISPFFLACSSDDDNGNNKTTFTIRSTAEENIGNATAITRINGDVIEISKIGNITTVQSYEIKVDYSKVKNIQIQLTENSSKWEVDTIFVLQPNVKNNFVITEGTKFIRLN